MTSKKIAVISNISHKSVHQVTFDNYFTKQGVEAFERGLEDLRNKKPQTEKYNYKKGQINLTIKNFLTLKIKLKN